MNRAPDASKNDLSGGEFRAGGKSRRAAIGAATRVAARGDVLPRVSGPSEGGASQCRAVGRSRASAIADATAVAAPLEAAWESIRTGLRRDCGARTFDGWLKPAELGGFDAEAGALELVMPSQFMADWVRSHFGERLALAWRTALPIVREVRIVAAADAPRPRRC